MHQTFDVHARQLHKEPERHNRSNHAVKLFANMITEEFALEPRHHIAGGIIGAPLSHGYVLTHLLHTRIIVWVFHQCWIKLSRRHYILRYLRIVNSGFDSPVHNQIGVAANR